MGIGKPYGPSDFIETQFHLSMSISTNDTTEWERDTWHRALLVKFTFIIRVDVDWNLLPHSLVFVELEQDTVEKHEVEEFSISWISEKFSSFNQLSLESLM